MKAGILWDLDGTLLDTLEDLQDGVNYALEKFGLPPRCLEEVRRFVGNGARTLMLRATEGRVDPEKALAVFHEYYDAHCRDKTRPYTGIPEALSALKERYPMAIVSNKPDVAVRPLCETWFPGIYARGEGPGCPRKPAPDMVFQAMEAIGVETCIYVGDSEVDVQTAKNAGVPCLSVLWGFRDRPEIEEAGAVYFCEKPENLAEAIEGILAGWE